MKQPPSDERLNALIDGELAPADAQALLEQLRTDAALRERLSELRLGKELVRHAYAGATPPSRAMPPQPHHGWRPAAAGFAALLCGTLLGWSARDRFLPATDAPTQLAGPAAQAPEAQAQRVVLHLGSAAPQHALTLLEHAEGILETARASGRTVSVEIVANAGGLDLLREGVSVHAGRIADLRAAYPELTLVACGQTAQRLREGGADLRLLPGTVMASSALDQIVLRMQQGWAYVRI
ncbi:MAG: hypothetical protein IPG91_09955 [Ideonella sp.]|nr:hypothetical protein [Ideonella sp.]